MDDRQRISAGSVDHGHAACTGECRLQQLVQCGGDRVVGAVGGDHDHGQHSLLGFCVRVGNHHLDLHNAHPIGLFKSVGQQELCHCLLAVDDHQPVASGSVDHGHAACTGECRLQQLVQCGGDRVVGAVGGDH